MAIAVDNKSTATASATQVSAEHICTGTGSNGIIVVNVQITDSSLSDRTISGVTHNGEACTHLPFADSDSPGDGLRTEIWYRINPTTGGTPDIVVTAGGKCTDLTFGAISLTGVNDDIYGIIDSYSETNFNVGQSLYSGATTATGQSLTGSGEALGSCKFYLKKSGSPTGNAVAKLYSHTGTYGTSSVPDSLLATSENFDVATLTTSYQLIEFNFNSTNRYTLTNGTHYCIVLEYSGGGVGNTVIYGLDSTSPTHDGNYYIFFMGGWTPTAAWDLCFYTYYSPITEVALDANTDPTLDITTIGDSSYVIDSLSSGESGGTGKITAVHRTGGSPIHETDVGSDFHGSQFVDAGGAGAQTMNWDDTDDDTEWALSAVAVTIAEVGGIFDLSVTDGIKAGDTRSETMAANPTITDGIDGGDTTSELGEMEVAATDGIELGDTALGVILSFLSVSDGIKLGDTTAESMVTASILTDGLKLGDVTTELGNMEVVVSDGVKLGDTALGILLKLLSITDGLKVGDNTLETMLASPSVIDGLKSGDTTSELGTMETLISDGIKLGDSTIGAILLLLSLTDGIKIGDATVESMLTDSDITDGIKLGDNTSGLVILLLSLTDGVKVGDSTVESMLTDSDISDGIKLGDSVTNVLIVYPTVADGILLGEIALIELIGAIVYNLSVIDGIKAGDNTIPGMSALVSAGDGIKLGDITVGNINYSVVVSDGLKVGDLIVKTGNFARGAKNLGQSRELKTFIRYLEQRRRI